MNQKNAKVDSDSKGVKINELILKKIVLDSVQGNQFLYISFRFDYKISS